jgi:spermidine synthase/ubiquinone/menaquinone biosynthesis C-methylase UbiE
MASLLPTDHSEFRTQQYWNDFFIKRQATTNSEDGGVESTFEWYGDWSDMSNLVGKYVPPTPTTTKGNNEVLVIGCGNSTTSEEMFEQGYKCVTSNDFSNVVIQEMTEKSKIITSSIQDDKTSWLRYEQMDFLNMSYNNDRFKLVFDKGALDALMSDDTPRSKNDATKLFSEVERVTEVGGAYVCITLAQKHIMKGFFRHFAKPGSKWDVHIHTFSPKLGSALCPFAFIAVKRDKPHPLTGMPLIRTYFDDGLKNVGQMKNEKEKKIGEQNTVTMAGTEVNMGQAIRSIVTMQQTHNFLGGPIKPGCAITLHLWPQHEKEKMEQDENQNKETKSSATTTTSSSTPTKRPKGPKFTVTVLDAEHTPHHGPSSCGVFIVPRGREVEFLFNTTEGQMDLAKQASFARFIVVAMERGYDFSGGLEQVKLELDPYMSKLAPPQGKNETASIPYLTTGTDSLGHRVEIYSGNSSYSGDYAVEEVLTNEDDEDGGTIVRRLIFLNNSNLVQSEVRLKKKKKNTDEMIPYHGHVAFEFHLTMACSIGLLNDSCYGNQNQNSIRVLIVGLGGGCLPMFLHEYFNQVDITCVEIDAEMKKIATDWFGYASTSKRMTTIIGDGVQYIQEWNKKVEEEKFDVVVFDVDAKDALLTGVSFPPKEFLTPSFISHVESTLLKKEGILCVNVASRSPKMFSKAIDTMKNIFSIVDVVKYEESLNRIVFAYKSETLDERSFSGSGEGLETLEAGSVLRRLKKRATKEWSEETDDDIMDAMSDITCM